MHLNYVSLGTPLFTSHLLGSTGRGHYPPRDAQPAPRNSDVYDLIANDELAAVPHLHPGTRMLIADRLAPAAKGGNLPGLRWS
jgi:hypothetical protein